MAQIKVDAFQTHPGQEEILESDTRFKVLDCGRRWGKGNCALRAIGNDALKNPKSEFWIVSPDFTFTEPMWNKALDAFDGVNIRTHGRSVSFLQDLRIRDRKLLLYNGSVIAFKSAHDPYKLGRGAGDRLMGVAFDEAAYTDPEAWKSLQPALMDNGAWGYFISTPSAIQPKNWFYDQYLYGQSQVRSTCEHCFGNGCEKCDHRGYTLVDNPERDSEFRSWQFSSYENPHISDEEIDKLVKRRGWSELDIQREIYGEFVGGDAVVFQYDDIVNCAVGKEEKFDPNYRYVTGVDLGRVGSYTVIITIKIPKEEYEKPHVAKMERFQGNWDLQKSRIMNHLRSYGSPWCFIDATGLGDQMEGDLRNLGARYVFPQKLTNTLKVQMVNALIAAVEGLSVTWYPQEQLEKEMLDFEASASQSGNIIYRKPKGHGMYDDMVLAFALSWWGYLKVGAPQRDEVWIVPIG